LFPLENALKGEKFFDEFKFIFFLPSKLSSYSSSSSSSSISYKMLTRKLLIDVVG
jgi:hypothetical protein